MTDAPPAHTPGEVGRRPPRPRTPVQRTSDTVDRFLDALRDRRELGEVDRSIAPSGHGDAKRSSWCVGDRGPPGWAIDKPTHGPTMPPACDGFSIATLASGRQINREVLLAESADNHGAFGWSIAKLLHGAQKQSEAADQ